MFLECYKGKDVALGMILSEFMSAKHRLRAQFRFATGPKASGFDATGRHALNPSISIPCDSNAV